jgi:trans-aconitate methyltransferase
MSFAMRSYAREVIGVDVAPRMLEVAREQARARGVDQVEFRSTLPDEPVDWVNSMIVLQHVPPARGHLILEQLVGLLNPGGWFSVQLTFFRDERHVGEITRDVADYRYDGQTVEVLAARDADVGSMSMYDYDLNRVFRTLFLAGIEEVMAKHTDDGGCHGAWFYGQKPR